MATIKEIIAGIEQKLTSNPPKGTTAVYQFNLTGGGGGNYFIDVKNNSASVGEGAHEKANIVITMTAGDFQNMVDGKLNATAAYMSGKIKISGDMGLAMSLQSILG